jgi:hypothetical protein
VHELPLEHVGVGVVEPHRLQNPEPPDQPDQRARV